MATLGIVGAGQMGTGIAVVFARAGHNVIMIEPDGEQQERSRARLAKVLGQLGLAADLIGNVAWQDTLDALAPCDGVVEAIMEKKDAKVDLFTRLSSILGPKAWLGTNTSSYPIGDLAGSFVDPSRFLGVHFMNPAYKIPLVEVIAGPQTDAGVVAAVSGLLTEAGQVPVAVKDRAGFIVNRLLIPMLNEAIQVLDEGIASAEGIDQAMTLGTNQPMGPLKLADMIGLDTCLAIMETLSQGLEPDAKYTPAKLLREYVRDGRLGFKTKHGFYTY